eukprot:TRINITY_DN2585_c0_g6_i2.p2 TRINITY_DN2585_c0_g6~~TRINITY_DN2585_c0_g6_i2.p2  ORF type:complete len:109 (+),score=1.24 TRINITY_DN2585_c0_g6_i2:144-470(+)
MAVTAEPEAQVVVKAVVKAATLAFSAASSVACAASAVVSAATCPVRFAPPTSTDAARIAPLVSMPAGQRQTRSSFDTLNAVVPSNESCSHRYYLIVPTQIRSTQRRNK